MYNAWSLYPHKINSDLSSWNDKVKKHKLIKKYRMEVSAKLLANSKKKTKMIANIS